MATAKAAGLDLGFTTSELREQIVNRAAERLVEGVTVDTSPLLTKLVNQKIQQAMDEAMRPLVEDGIESLVMQETNQWGEARGKSVTFREYIVQRCEAYLREKVNYEGKAKSESGGFSWTGTQTRLTHMVHKHLHYQIESAIKEAIKVANSQLGAALEDTVRLKLDEIGKSLKVTVEPK